MPWTEKSYAYNGPWVKGVVQVPAVTEDLFEDCSLEEAKKAARPFVTFLDESKLYSTMTLTAADLIAAREDLWEIEYRLKSLTEEQDREVEKLYQKAGAGKNDPDPE